MNKLATEKPVKETQVSTPEPANKILFALHEVMSKVGYVQKKDRNAFQQYNYAGEGALLETLRPAMVEAGLILIPSGTERAEIDQYGITNVTVEYTLAHKDGEVWPDKIRAYGAGGDKNKNGVGDKGLYKALTGANKYLLFKLFQIETGDDPEIPNAQDKGETKDDAPEEPKPTQGNKQDEPRRMSKGDAREPYAKLLNELKQIQSSVELEAWGNANREAMLTLPADWQNQLRDEYREHRTSLEQRAVA